MRAFVFVICLLAAFALVVATDKAPSLSEQLFLEFLPPNEAASAVAPPTILFAETAIVVRYTLMGAIAIYDPQAACQPSALSFFGVRDELPPAFCDPDRNAVIQSYAIYRALVREFPAEAENYAEFLRRLQLEPASNSTDKTTENGWGNFFGDRIADFFASDGWNSLGDVVPGRDLVQFQDYTGYRPVNAPELDADSLRKPLRWQPFLSSPDGNGRFISQVHVVPQIAKAVDTLVLTEKDIKARRVSGPFKGRNEREILPEDEAKAKMLLNEVISISASLTAEQRFFARWWDNKLLSTASISAYYEEAAELSRFQIAQQFMGEMMSQHDALVMVWKEKRRFDLARPRTLMQRLFANRTFKAFISEEEGVGMVSGANWKPLKLEQPHSEFPSASAALCTAAMEHIQTYVENKLEGGEIPAIKFVLPAMSQPFFQPQDQTISFKDPLEAGMNCGRSRLWGGVHFRPAVDAGMRIGKGIGKTVFEHIKLLGEGRVPPNCRRCTRS